jgi:hypothetical protein
MVYKSYSLEKLEYLNILIIKYFFIINIYIYMKAGKRHSLDILNKNHNIINNNILKCLDKKGSKIAIIGNCQMQALSFFLQSNTSNYLVKYCSYGNDYTPKTMKENHDSWAEIFKDTLIFNKNDSINFVKEADFIFCQVLANNGDPDRFLYHEKILEIKKNTCEIFTIPSIFVHPHQTNFEDQISELQNRERHNKNDILSSDIIIEYELENKNLPPNNNKYVHTNSMLTTNHPKTYIFINLTNKILKILNEPIISDELHNYYSKNENFINMPTGQHQY